MPAPCLRPPPYTLQYPQYPSAALRSHPRAAPIRLHSVALPGAMVPSRCRPQGGAACRAVPCRAVPCRAGVWARSTWSYGRLRRRKARRPAAQRPRSTSGARSPSARGSRMLSSKVRPPSPAPSVVAGQSGSVRKDRFCGGASVRATGDGASRAHRLPHWMWTRSSVSKLVLAAVGMLPQRLVRRWVARWCESPRNAVVNRCPA